MNIILSFFLYIVVAHWMIVSVFTIIGLVGYLLYKPTKKGEEHKDTEIIIVSKASKSVEGVLFESIKHNATILSSHHIYVVIDEDSELFLRLKTFIASFKNVELVIVPKSFKCIAIAKGRAIEYFIRTCAVPTKWYAFVDDDNLILDKTFLNEISYYSKRGYVACNGLLYPRCGKSKIAFIADAIRYYDDITIFRIGTGILKTPVSGFHGELLVASGECLKEITFNRKTITEDFAFSRELIKKNMKTWQSETIVSIQSPHSYMDFIKQRNRWYRGISEDVKTANWKMKLFTLPRIIDWKMGIVGSWAVFPVWFLLPVPLPVSLFCTIGLLYYYVAYISGVMRLKETYLLYAIPFFGIMETYSPHLFVKNKMDFNVIEK